MNATANILKETSRNYANVILPVMSRAFDEALKRDKLLQSYFDSDPDCGGAYKPLPAYFRNYMLREYGINIDHFVYVK